MEIRLIFKTLLWLLSLAFMSGLVLAGFHFLTDRRSPPWLGKLHSFSVLGAISLLGFAWLTGELGQAGTYGLLALFLAAGSGLTINLCIGSNRKQAPDWLVFVHMCVAFIGFLMVFLALLSILKG